MHITKRTAIPILAVLLAVVAARFGVVVTAFASALAALGLVVGLMGYSAFVALRNWQLDKLPRRRPAPPHAVEPRDETRRAA